MERGDPFPWRFHGDRRKGAMPSTFAGSVGAYLDITTTTHTYDPRDRLTSLTKTDTSSGNPIGSETYDHDANSNVITRTAGWTPSSRTVWSVESYRYDGFDRITRHSTTDTSGTASTAYTIDQFAEHVTGQVLGHVGRLHANARAHVRS